MHRSKIEWVRNPDNKTLGWVWNPITGCLNGCSYCYARKLANGRLKKRYLANAHLANTGQLIDEQKHFADPCAIEKALEDPFYPRFWSDRLKDIKRGYHAGDAFGRWQEPKARGIFCCDMSDLFGIGIPEEWTRKVLGAINEWDNRNDRFYLLTKQPQNLVKFSPFPKNCWVGVTATNYEMTSNALSYLFSVEAKVKFISFEPLLEPIVRNMYFPAGVPCEWGRIDWIIIGAQTHPLLKPRIEWVKELTEVATREGIAVFHKNNLKETAMSSMLLSDKEFEKLYRVPFRQEVPCQF